MRKEEVGEERKERQKEKGNGEGRRGKETWRKVKRREK